MYMHKSFERVQRHFKQLWTTYQPKEDTAHNHVYYVYTSDSSNTSKESKLLFLPYVKGVSERIERGCRKLGVRTAFKSRHTLRESLMKVKNVRPIDLKKGAVYEVPCGALQQSVHWWDGAEPAGENKRTQVCSEEPRHEERHSCTCMDSTAYSWLVSGHQLK